MEERRGFSCRQGAREGMPAPVARLGPAQKVWEPPEGSWAHFLGNRHGWLGVVFTAPRRADTRTHNVLLLLFLCGYEGVTHAVDFGVWPVDGSVTVPVTFDLSEHLTPLESVWEGRKNLEGQAVAWEVGIQVTVSPDGFRVTADTFLDVDGPLPRTRRSAGVDGESSDGDPAIVAAGAGDRALGAAGSKKPKGDRGSDSGSGAESVASGAVTTDTSDSEVSDYEGPAARKKKARRWCARGWR